MKKPMTTAQAIDKFGDSGSSIEGSTCSMRCKNCEERIWFRGDWWDADTPKTFQCPSCLAKQEHPYKPRMKATPRLDKGDLSILITVCEKECEFSPLSKQIIQPTLDKLNTMMKELH